MKALVICSGSIEYAKAALDLVKEKFEPEKIYVVTQREAYKRGLKDLKPPYKVLLLTSPSSLLAAIKSLRRENMDLRVSLFTGEYGHRRLKSASLLFGAKKKYIYTKNHKLHEFTLRNWRAFLRYVRQECLNILKPLVLTFIKIAVRILRLMFFPLIFLYLLFNFILRSTKRKAWSKQLGD